MYTTTITFPVKQWRKLRADLKQLPDEISKGINRELTAMTNDAVEEFEKYPGPVKYPIQWTSAKQRRWYFWTKGGFLGPAFPEDFQPYKRTGAIANNWRVLRQGNQYESTLVFSNSTPYLPYVMGRWRQRFHANTGWEKLDLVSDRVRARVRRRITRISQIAAAQIGR